MLDWPDDLGDLSLAADADAAKVETVARCLGRVLNWGGLALFIGAGVSKVIDLPMWTKLNSNIVQGAAAILEELFPKIWCNDFKSRLPTPDDLQNQTDVLELLDRVEKVCSACETLAYDGAANDEKYVGNAPSWHEIVRRSLYQGAQQYKFEAMFHPELVSLCSLLIGYRRGNVREVVTFNYDDLIQSYLRLHGHSCNVVSPLPFELSPNSGTTFYHPHGYLPLQDKEHRASPFIVLTKQAYRPVRSGAKRHAKQWRRLIASLLSVRIGLFVGISGNDDILELYFDETEELAGEPIHGRPLAFAILVGEHNRPAKKWLEDKIIPLEFPNPDAVARFLAQICQQAALLLRASVN